MKLYYSNGACSLTTRITLHEIGIDCDYESVNLKTKITGTDADYLKINPKGSVPALLTDSNELLTENTAILQYLAEKHHATELLPLVGDFKRYRVLEWLSFVSTDLHKNCGALFNPNVSDKEKEEIFRPILKNKLKIVEQQLSKNKYLVGNLYTLPDAYLFVILRWMPSLKIDFSDLPKLTHYFSELKTRKSIQQAMQEEGISA